ncbi:cytochrome P450 [Striga asiatica]|uniref:Cytochrome P450 n=1 Tax=Striga asiatica TaxID=4170 RepID=A0A5A7R8E9_STRAF|nr:cytochrome P450 [Striga asiatica]
MSDVIPWIEWMDIGGYLIAMKTTTEDIDRVLENWLQERMLVKNEDDCSNSNLMDVMISELNENYVVEGHDRNLGDTVVWAVSLLLNNVRVLQTAGPRTRHQETKLSTSGREGNTAALPAGSTSRASSGVGRRVYRRAPIGGHKCPGVDFALLVVHLALARLLQAFDLSKPTGAAVDMIEANGLALPK